MSGLLSTCSKEARENECFVSLNWCRCIAVDILPRKLCCLLSSLTEIRGFEAQDLVAVVVTLRRVEFPRVAT